MITFEGRACGRRRFLLRPQRVVGISLANFHGHVIVGPGEV